MEAGRWARAAWSWACTAVALVVGPATLDAQAAPLAIPGGAIRIAVGVGMDSWNGVLPGPGQPVAIEAAQATRLSGSFGLAIGVTSRVTLFGTVPFERVRVQAHPSDPAVTIPGDRAGGLGDATAGVALRVAGTAAETPGGGPRLELALSTWFPTGRVLRTSQYYSLTTGSGTGGVEAAARLHLPAGRMGLRLDGAYLVPAGTTHDGSEPGAWFRVSAAPWLKIARPLALEGIIEQTVRDDADGGGATVVGGGLALFAPGSTAGRSLPLAAFWRVTKVVSANEGAPAPIGATAGLQLYYGLFR